jgi:hypothetical protein
MRSRGCGLAALALTPGYHGIAPAARGGFGNRAGGAGGYRLTARAALARGARGLPRWWPRPVGAIRWLPGASAMRAPPLDHSKKARQPRRGDRNALSERLIKTLRACRLGIRIPARLRLLTVRGVLTRSPRDAARPIPTSQFIALEPVKV